MVNLQKLMENLFDKKSISSMHLLTFAKDHLKRLTANNTNHAYDDMIALLTPLITDFATEMGNQDTSKNIRKGQTISVEDVIATFGRTMSELEGAIALKMGGKKSVGYLEIYPNGLTEYHRPNREDMAFYANRIKKAATKYSTVLGDEMAQELKAIDTNFAAARNQQATTIAEVSKNTSAVTSNQVALELALTQSVHFIGQLFPGNYEGCKNLFNENLLYAVTHHKHEVFSDTIVKEGTQLVLNRTLTDSMMLEVKNQGSNAAFWIWLGANATDTDNSMAVEVQSNRTVVLKPSDIGILSKTFLLIKNDSAENDAIYQVTLIA